MKKILFILLIILTMIFPVSCKEDKILPPEKGDFVAFVVSSVIYQNDGSTLYSIGDVGPVFTFYYNTLDVKNSEETNIYEISYDEIPLTNEDFRKQFQPENELPDISSCKNIVQYDLCEATNELPGYRLYILDGEYWMGTLYKDSIWRIVSLSIDK